MRSGTITEFGESITVQGETVSCKPGSAGVNRTPISYEIKTVSCKQEKLSYRIALPNPI